jgi:hypothetical protein
VQFTPVTTSSFISGPNILLRTLFSNTSISVLLPAWETNFHTHRTQPVVYFNLCAFR